MLSWLRAGWVRCIWHAGVCQVKQTCRRMVKNVKRVAAPRCPGSTASRGGKIRDLGYSSSAWLSPPKAGGRGRRSGKSDGKFSGAINPAQLKSRLRALRCSGSFTVLRDTGTSMELMFGGMPVAGIRRCIRAGAGLISAGPALRVLRRRTAEPSSRGRQPQLAVIGATSVDARRLITDQARQCRASAHDRRSDRYRRRIQHRSRWAIAVSRGQNPIRIIPAPALTDGPDDAAVGTDGAHFASERRRRRRARGTAAAHRKGSHGGIHAGGAIRAGGEARRGRRTRHAA